MLSVRNLEYRVGKKEILRGITTEFSPGTFHVIVGPNGSGKSTFLKTFSGELKPQHGEVIYDKQDVFSINKTELARKRAVLSQQAELHFPLSVEEIVMMGRYPHFAYKPTPNDHAICSDAMKNMDVEDLIDRDYLTLSGGEKQRVQFARVLAQLSGNGSEFQKYLFLDEAVSHLDLKHQHQLLNIAKAICSQGAVVIAILHDLNLSINYADRIVFMKQGKIVYDLGEGDSISSSIIKDVFDVDARIISPGNGHKPIVVF
jgi:heme transport system ATP-binding protein